MQRITSKCASLCKSCHRTLFNPIAKRNKIKGNRIQRRQQKLWGEVKHAPGAEENLYRENVLIWLKS